MRIRGLACSFSPASRWFPASGRSARGPTIARAAAARRARSRVPTCPRDGSAQRAPAPSSRRATGRSVRWIRQRTRNNSADGDNADRSTAPACSGRQARGRGRQAAAGGRPRAMPGRVSPLYAPGVFACSRTRVRSSAARPAKFHLRVPEPLASPRCHSWISPKSRVTATILM